MGHHYRQLTREERYQISALKKLGFSQAEIARRVGKSASTVSRELMRNRGSGRYDGARAQRMSDTRRRTARKNHKRHKDLLDWVNARLGEDWSPEQIVGSMREYGYALVSHEWIYRHIIRDQANGGKLYLQLRQKRKKYKKRYGSGSRSSRIPNRIGIEERPQIVAQRLRVGDWEGDTVVGNGPAALVTLVERKTGFIAIRKVPRATAEHTTKAIIAALGPWQSVTKTLTLDNGTEFAHHEAVAKELGCGVYFARPYHSWERGANENANGLIRQYFPKGSDFANVSETTIQEVEDKLNMRPRKRLGFRAPIELFPAWQ